MVPMPKKEDGFLALILARDAVFGAKIMSSCTHLGTKNKQALPPSPQTMMSRTYLNATPSVQSAPVTPFASNICTLTCIFYSNNFNVVTLLKSKQVFTHVYKKELEEKEYMHYHNIIWL